jgi:hypothetical protein
LNQHVSWWIHLTWGVRGEEGNNSRYKVSVLWRTDKYWGVWIPSHTHGWSWGRSCPGERDVLNFWWYTSYSVSPYTIDIWSSRRGTRPGRTHKKPGDKGPECMWECSSINCITYKVRPTGGGRQKVPVLWKTKR